MRSAALLFMLTACHPEVKAAFDARRAATLAAPPALEEPWAPDTSLRLAPSTVSRLVETALADAALQTDLKLGGVEAHPSLRVARLSLVAPQGSCTSCVGLDGTLDGTLTATALGMSVDAGLHVDLTLDVQIDTVSGPDEVRVIARPVRVRDLAVRLDGVVSFVMDRLPLGPLEQWVSRQVLAAVPEVPLFSLGAAGLPIRAVKVIPRADEIQLAVRLDGPGGAAVALAPAVDEGWSARVHTDAVLGLVRRDLFRSGPVTHDVWVDPTRLSIRDDRFTLGLRLWRPKGAAWWLDVEVEGDATFTRRGDLSLTAREVRDVAASPGAGIADPVVGLARQALLQGIAEAFRFTLPTGQASQAQTGPATWRPFDVWTDGDTLVFLGALDTPAPRKGRR